MGIIIENLSKSYGTVDVLENVNLEINEGEFLCITGPSGCGKTTLLRLIAGFESYQGKILIDGKQVTSPGTDRFMVFQQFNQLLPWKTVYGNIEFGLRLKGLKNRDGIMKLISLVGLDDFVDAYPHQLSGGMKQRVAVARAFISNPTVLLMDEPFGSLDAQTKRKIQRELLEIWSSLSKTIIFVTHSIREAILMADRVAILTKRPAGNKAMVDIKMKRPRDQSSPAFGEYWKEVINLIEA